MNNKIVNISIVDGNTITQTTELRIDPQGQPVQIDAVQNGKYILARGENGVAPKNVTLERVGEDLHITLDNEEQDEPQLIIRGFYLKLGLVVGVDENGVYHQYTAANASQAMPTETLTPRMDSPQELSDSKESLTSSSDNPNTGSGTSFNWRLLGAAGLAGGIYAYNRAEDKRNKHDDPATPPATPRLKNIDDDIGDKTGSIKSGSSTDDSTPVFTGTGTPGNTVYIMDGGKVIGTSIVGKDGQWTFTPTTALAHGEHIITLIEKDAAGNKSEPTAGFKFNVDLKAPKQPVISDVLDDEKNQQVPQNGMTADNTPTLKGTAEPGASVEVFANGIKIGEAPVDTDGTWTFTPDEALSDGPYSFTSVTVDSAGNRGLQSQPYDLIIQVPDTTAPDKPGSDEIVDDNGQVIAEGTQNDDIVIADSDSDSTEGQNPPVTAPVNDPPVAVATIDSMSKDSGTNRADFVTNNGSAGRLIKGSLSAPLTVDEKIQVSVDGGRTWQDAVLNGDRHWSFVDKNSHHEDWEIQTQVVDSLTHLVGDKCSQYVTLDTSAPDAPATLEVRTDSVTLKFDGHALVDGDSICLSINGQRLDYALTPQDIAGGAATIIVPLTLQPLDTANVEAAIVDAAGNSSQYLSQSGVTLDNGISSIEVIDLTGDNPLKLSQNDALINSATSLFHNSGPAGMELNADKGNTVERQGLSGTEESVGWAVPEPLSVGGVAYDVYRHSGLDGEYWQDKGLLT